MREDSSKMRVINSGLKYNYRNLPRKIVLGVGELILNQTSMLRFKMLIFQHVGAICCF